MATRLYYNSGGTAPISPTVHSGWTDTDSSFFRSTASATKQSSPYVNKINSVSTWRSPTLQVIGQFIYGPIGAQTITGNVKGQMYCSESNADTDAMRAIVARVVSADGTVVRGVLYSGLPGVLASEYAAGSQDSSEINRNFPASSALSSVDAQNGDYIVIEIGDAGFKGSSSARFMRHIILDDQATDAPEDETDSNRSTMNPWIEFSNTIAPYVAPSPTTYPNIDLVPTNDFNPAYNRVTLQPMTSPTWKSLQDSGITYQALQASSFVFGEENFITDQETYITKPIDIGSIVTGSFIVDLRTFSSSNLGFVSVQISTSTDGITYSNFQTFVAGQYTARYVKLKFLIQATDSSTKVRIISAILTVDVPDIDQSLLNQAISSLGTTINLTGFTSVKSVVMTTVGAASSLLSPQITDQSGLPNSFVVKMFDKTDTPQSGNVNIYVKGY